MAQAMDNSADTNNVSNQGSIETVSTTEQENDNITMAEPIYIKHKDLVETRLKADYTIIICDSINKTLGNSKSAKGAVKDRALWVVFVENQAARAAILQRGLLINNMPITCYDKNPYSKQYDSEYSPTKNSEIVTFKGFMPNEDLKNEAILQYLNDKEGIIKRSDIIWSKSRREDNSLSEYYNGNRHVYLEEGFEPFPKQIMLGQKKIFISHKSQEKYCNRCKGNGHMTKNIHDCPAYTEENQCILFNNGVLSNMYKHDIAVQDKTFHSSEQAYQYAKCIKLQLNDIANDIMKTDNPFDAKKLTKKIDRELLKKEWDQDKFHIMMGILQKKAEQCLEFRTALIDSKDKMIYEATRDRIWGCGLTADLAEQTKAEYYPGTNLQGEALMMVREHILEEERKKEAIEKRKAAINGNTTGKTGTQPSGKTQAGSSNQKNKENETKNKENEENASGNKRKYRSSSTDEKSSPVNKQNKKDTPNTKNIWDKMANMLT